MLNQLKKGYYKAGAAMTTALTPSKKAKNVSDSQYFSAVAAALVTGALVFGGAEMAEANNFSKIADNTAISAASVPGVLTMGAYVGGIVFGIKSILGFKQYMENPGQTAMKVPASFAAASAGCLVLPFGLDVLANTLDNNAGGNQSGENLDKAKLFLN